VYSKEWNAECGTFLSSLCCKMKAVRDALASDNVLFISASNDDFERNRLFNFIPKPDD
jgi:hypothetical protein